MSDDNKIKYTEPLHQLVDDRNMNKYKTAGTIVSKVLDLLIKETKPGAKIYDLCVLGDKTINEEVGKIYKTVKRKGIAFPTCISINNVAGHFSPTKDDTTVIKDGDLVKIELGVHIDGFPAFIVYPVLVNESVTPDPKIVNLLKAAANASKEVAKAMKPGNTNKNIVNIINKHAENYACNVTFGSVSDHMPGVFSCQVSQYIIDGFDDDIMFDTLNDDNEYYIHRFIMNKDYEAYDFSMPELELEEDEVYSIDIAFSSGSGKLNLVNSTINNTIYKRLINKQKINLKFKSSKSTLNEFKLNPFPINVRDNLTGMSGSAFKFGLKECIDKGLIDTYPVVVEKEGEYVIRIKFTIVVRDKPVLITGRSVDEQIAKVK